MILELLKNIGLSPFVFMHWMLAVSITLFIFDIFFQTEFLSWIALIIFASYFSILIDETFGIPIQWSILLFIIFLAGAFIFHYVVWHNMVTPVIRKTLLKNAVKEQSERAVGDVGTFRIIEGNNFVEWNGELWTASFHDDLEDIRDNQKVKIIRISDGKFFVSIK